LGYGTDLPYIPGFPVPLRTPCPLSGRSGDSLHVRPRDGARLSFYRITIQMSEETPQNDGAPRRTFLAAVGAVIAGGLAGVAPVVAGLATLLDPLRRTGDDGNLVMVTKLAVLPADGIPRKFTVSADRVDAWTTYQNTPVGAVYLRRMPNDEIVCLNVVCPHAGCFVNLAPAGTHYACPCHRSRFALDGTIDDPASPAPRAMDELTVEIRNEDEVWVRFQNFQPGQEHKVPIV